MSEEKKSTYKGFTEAHKRGNERYRKKLAVLHVYVPKDKADDIKAHAAQRGESMNHFVVRAIDETMKKDTEA